MTHLPPSTNCLRATGNASAREESGAAWPLMRTALPHDKPLRRTRPVIWRYRDVRPRAARGRRPGADRKGRAARAGTGQPGSRSREHAGHAVDLIGLQLILPGETAPNHRHSPSAVRLVIEGSGGFTLVQGEKCPMERGDLILTPSGLWHEHGHEGLDP